MVPRTPMAERMKYARFKRRATGRGTSIKSLIASVGMVGQKRLTEGPVVEVVVNCRVRFLWRLDCLLLLIYVLRE